MKKQKRCAALLAAALSASLILSGCGQGDTGETETETAAQLSDFDQFMRDEFKEAVSTDTLTLHYYVANPSAYGIDDSGKATFGSVDTEYTDDYSSSLQESLDGLHAFDYDSLTSDQKLTYKVYETYLNTEKEYSTEDLFYYNEPLSTMSGEQSMYPIMMAEYDLEDREDISTYLSLLDDTDNYFSQLLAYEQKKSEAGLFMSDECLDEVIDACSSFTDDTDDNVLITSFEERLDNIDGLTVLEKKSYEKKNKKKVENVVIPAYEDLVNGLEKLRGTGKNDKGLCYYDQGQKYLEYLLRQTVGTNKDAAALEKEIESDITGKMNELQYLIVDDPTLIDGFYDDISMSDPDKMLKKLQKKLVSDFPEAVTDDYELEYVPDSLADSTNPAFYFVPPVDVDQNIIFLNKSQIDSNISLFDTLSHEGYPGHLYQQTYFKATNPAEIRLIFGYNGYIEGWATYVEHYSFGWAGLDENAAHLQALNLELTLDMYGYLDLAINNDGWTEDQTADYLAQFGISGSDTVHEVYMQIVGNPGSYLPYVVGYLEFQSLYDNAQDKAGADFDPVAFHKEILTIGPCSFDILEARMLSDGYINSTVNTDDSGSL